MLPFFNDTSSKPTDVDIKYKENAQRVRVSKYSGTVLPYPPTKELLPQVGEFAKLFYNFKYVIVALSVWCLT